MHVFKSYQRTILTSLDKSKYQKYLKEGPIHDNLRKAIEKEGYEVREDAKLKKVKDQGITWRKEGGWWIIQGDKKEYRIFVTGKIMIDTAKTVSDHIDHMSNIKLFAPSEVFERILFGQILTGIIISGVLFIIYSILVYLFFGSIINIPQELIGGLSGLAIGAIYGSILGIFRARVHSLIQRLEDLFEGLSQKKSGSMKSRGKKQPSSSVPDSHRCGRCGTKNPKKADFCKNCGEKLEGTEVW